MRIHKPPSHARDIGFESGYYMKKSALGIFFALAVLAGCGEDSSNKPRGETKRSTTVVRRSIQKGSDVTPPAKARAKKPSRFLYVRTACNIRRGPGTRYPIGRRAGKGEKLEYISLVGNWYKLKVKKGRSQEWVHKSVVISPGDSPP
jgi:uncharacterized protein YgiM (DUF1202 family)